MAIFGRFRAVFGLFVSRFWHVEELRELFKLLDSDGSGEVDTAEFDGAFEIPELKNKLLLIGLEEAVDGFEASRHITYNYTIYISYNNIFIIYTY